MIRFLAIGDWKQADVRCAWRECSRAINRGVEEQIDFAWQQALKQARGIQLFDGPMCRLERWEAAPARLALEFSQTSYRIFYGTHLSEGASKIDPACRANALGAS